MDLFRSKHDTRKPWGDACGLSPGRLETPQNRQVCSCCPRWCHPRGKTEAKKSWAFELRTDVGALICVHEATSKCESLVVPVGVKRPRILEGQRKTHDTQTGCLEGKREEKGKRGGNRWKSLRMDRNEEVKGIQTRIKFQTHTCEALDAKSFWKWVLPKKSK